MDVNVVLQRYPFDVKLEDGSDFTIRPLAKEDKIMLARFFQAISEEDRFYLKENVTAPEVIHGWIDNMDYDRAVPIVAIPGLILGLTLGGRSNCQSGSCS